LYRNFIPIALFGFKATYYHGGLQGKDKNMQLWMDDKAQVIVATNAFGMGIDRCQDRYSHPTSEKSKIIIKKQVDLAEMEKKHLRFLTNPSDIKQAENQFIHILPDKKFLNEMYNKLCNFFKLLMEKGSTKDSPLTIIFLFEI
jgi:ATP-dependent DNA helicase RecQ